MSPTDLEYFVPELSADFTRMWPKTRKVSSTKAERGTEGTTKARERRTKGKEGDSGKGVKIEASVVQVGIVVTLATTFWCCHGSYLLYVNTVRLLP